MIDIDFEVAVVSIAIMAFGVGIYGCLLNIKAAPTSLRTWRIALASGCALSLVGSVMGLARMLTSWHPWSGEICMLLVVGGGLVDLVSAAMILTEAPEDGPEGAKRESWLWPR